MSAFAVSKTPVRSVSRRATHKALAVTAGAAAVLALVGPGSASAMLQCVSDDGSVSYSSVRINGSQCIKMNTIAEGPVVAAATKAVAAGDVPQPVDVSANAANASTTDKLDTRSYQSEIDAAAQAYRVDKALVRAVIQAESAFHPNATSHAGAQGLMQLMPTTASRFGVNNPFDAAQNIRGGVQYLAWLLKRFDGNLDLALASYNSGEATVNRYSGVPPYEETRNYVARVRYLAARYQSVS